MKNIKLRILVIVFPVFFFNAQSAFCLLLPPFQNSPLSSSSYSIVNGRDSSDSADKLKVELYNAGISAFKATDYQKSIECFNEYKKRFPDEIYGYYWCFRNAVELDKNMSKGLAVDDAIKLIQMGERDIKVFKPTLILACQYLTDYYSKVNIDIEKLKYYSDKLNRYDPGNIDAR